MELEKGLKARTEELKITYEGERTDFKDDTIAKTAKELGFTILHCGYNFLTRTRDMTFGNKEMYWRPDNFVDLE